MLCLGRGKPLRLFLHVHPQSCDWRSVLGEMISGPALYLKEQHLYGNSISAVSRSADFQSIVDLHDLIHDPTCHSVLNSGLPFFRELCLTIQPTKAGCRDSAPALGVPARGEGSEDVSLSLPLTVSGSNTCSFSLYHQQVAWDWLTTDCKCPLLDSLQPALQPCLHLLLESLQCEL